MYVNVVPSIAHVHFVAATFTPLKLKSLLPQLHSFAFDAVMNCANVILFAAFPTFHVLNALAVGTTSLNVYVAVFVATFH